MYDIRKIELQSPLFSLQGIDVYNEPSTEGHISLTTSYSRFDRHPSDSAAANLSQGFPHKIRERVRRSSTALRSTQQRAGSPIQMDDMQLPERSNGNNSGSHSQNSNRDGQKMRCGGC